MSIVTSSVREPSRAAAEAGMTAADHDDIVM